MTRHLLTQPLGAVPLALAARIGQLETQMASFNARWAAAGLTDANLPPAFVLDLLTGLLDDVIKPFTDLRLQMVQRLANVNVARELAAAGAVADRVWSEQLVPVFLQARDLAARGVATMRVVIPGARTAEQGLRYHVNRVMVEVIDGYEAIAGIQEAQPWFLQLGTWSDKAIGYLVKAGEMVEQAKRVIAAAGDLIYRPINEAGKWADRIIKLSAIGVVAYILWATRKPGRSR